MLTYARFLEALMTSSIFLGSMFFFMGYAIRQVAIEPAVEPRRSSASSELQRSSPASELQR
jgi:hypothetical protein